MVKIGIIGCGKVASEIHIPAIKQNNNVELISCFDINNNLARKISEKHSLHLASSFSDLLDNVDIVDICTPPMIHAKYIKASLLNKKHVITEKPFTLSYSDCIKLIELSKKYSLKLSVIQNQRCLPSVIKAKKIIDDSNVGKILSGYACAHVNNPMKWSGSLWPFDNKIGVLYETGSHIIDTVLFISGLKPTAVSILSNHNQLPLGNIGTILFAVHCEGGAGLIFDLSWLGGTFQTEISFKGTGGIINIDIQNDFLEHYYGYIVPNELLYNSIRLNYHVFQRIIKKEYFAGPMIYHNKILSEFIDSIIYNKPVPIDPISVSYSVKVMEGVNTCIAKNINYLELEKL